MQRAESSLLGTLCAESFFFCVTWNIALFCCGPEEAAVCSPRQARQGAGHTNPNITPVCVAPGPAAWKLLYEALRQLWEIPQQSTCKICSLQKYIYLFFIYQRLKPLGQQIISFLKVEKNKPNHFPSKVWNKIPRLRTSPIFNPQLRFCCV